MKIKNIFDKKYVIITHRLFTGAGQDLYRFLKKNSTNYVLLVQHSFSSVPNRKTTFSEFKNNKQNIRECLDYKFLPDLIVYAKDFLYSFFGILFNRNKFDLIVGCGGFNALSALLLKWMRKSEKVVFYTIDFDPNRFNNYLLDKLYLMIDKICVRYADQTWNLCERMIEGRGKYNNMAPERFNRQKTVPVGIWLDDLSELRHRKVDKKILVFCGHLMEIQGIQLVLEAIPEIVKSVPSFKSMIVGEGEYTKTLMDLVRYLKIEQYVEFKGPIYDQKVLIKILCSARAGIAPYKEEGNLSVYFADSTKPKVYLACGLPLIITKVAWIHEEVEKRNMGIVINYDKQQLIAAVVKLMTDDKFYLMCKRNANQFVVDLDWSKIFGKALRELENV